MEKRVMSLSRRIYSKEFKEAAVRRLELGASVAEVACTCEVNPQRFAPVRGTKTFSGNGKSRVEEARVAELERKVGRQAIPPIENLGGGSK
jgi:transposase-like protein